MTKLHETKKVRALRRANSWCLVLMAIGGLQMLGFCVGSRVMRGIGASSAASPFPKVFCSAPVHSEPELSLETFSAEFALRYQDEGKWIDVELTPEIYSRLSGPYNRRNVYGAVLAYGPCLPPEMVTATLQYALVDPAPMRRELGVPETASDLRVVIRGRASGQLREWEITSAGSLSEPKLITP